MAKDSNNSEDEMVYIVVKDESEDEENEMALISHVSKNDTWIIETGYSHHMIRDNTKFQHLEHYDGESVRFGNNEPCCIKRKGRYKGKIPLIYFSCEEIGHIAAKCPNKEKKQENKSKKYKSKK